MLKNGDTVKHANANESFGNGKVLKVNEAAGTALVEWESHEVTRESSGLKNTQTHVKISSLVKV